MRTDSTALREALASLTHAPTWLAVHAERAVSRALGGSCSMPLAAWAHWQGGTLVLQARLGHPVDAAYPLHVVNVSAEVTDTAAAEALGLEAARQLRAAGGQVCLDAAAALSAGA